MKRKIAEYLLQRDGIAIFSHRDPDGDAVGSALGLLHLLRDAGRKAHVLLEGGVPKTYHFVPGAAEVVESMADLPEPPDTFVVLDATSPGRLGDLESALVPGVPVVNMDHHPDNSRFGDLCWVDPTACATALMIHELARGAGWKVGSDAAQCLYTGIVTDTGRFTFSNTDARGMVAAAELAGLGADPHEVATRVYESASPESVKLLARALSTLDFRDGGTVASLYVTQDMLDETGAAAEDSDGFSTYARSIEGVKVGLFFRETGEGTVKVSFRSNEGVKIDGVAGRFGGGGHPSASGARVPGPIQEAKESVVRAVSEHLRGNGA